MKKIIVIMFLIIIAFGVQAQKKKTKTIKYPSTIEVYIDFDKGSSYYTKAGLDILDSIYTIAFNKDNSRFYKITITGYDDGEPLNEQNSSLARERAVMVFKYFSSREETEYIIKRTPSYYESSCEGKKQLYIKYKIPFDFKWINLANNDDWKTDNKPNPTSKVHILIEEDQDGCLGSFLDYDYPSQDTLLKGSYSKVNMPKGCIAYIHHTKDTLHTPFNVDFKEFMSFEYLIDNYSLVPHKRQYILNAGYLVICPSMKIDYQGCQVQDTAGKAMHISLFLEEQQRESGLKFYATTINNKGEKVYKTIKTQKRKDKETGEMWIEADVYPNQLDTIYVGKKIEEKEMKDYFYSARSDEPGSFEAMGGYLRPYKLDKTGKMLLKDKMKAILRHPIGTM